MAETAKMLDLRSFSLEELTIWLKENGQQAFRAKQIYEWLWKHGAGSIDDMTTLSLDLRESLKEHFVIHKLALDQFQKSEDGTIKSAFSLHDKGQIEGVLIPSKDRVTACVSSQSGCSLACKFCATGFLDLQRNLEAGEIYDQVKAINEQSLKDHGRNLTNIVYMGMGEPLLNYSQVVRSIEHITSPQGLAMSPSRITVSTAGIEKAIRRLADDDVKFNLALSLHAPTDEQRSKIMPINESNSIGRLMDALEYFYNKTKNKLTYEYILFKDFNDSEEDAINLAKLCKRFRVIVNLIEYNSVDGTSFKKPEREVVEKFQKVLQLRGVDSFLRVSRGKDIDAACGQLANKLK